MEGISSHLPFSTLYFLSYFLLLTCNSSLLDTRYFLPKTYYLKHLLSFVRPNFLISEAYVENGSTLVVNKKNIVASLTSFKKLIKTSSLFV